jgi:non-lysosomal glucosylceramidase
MGARNLAEPELQLGAGCLVDQLVGQYMAHVCGLGYLLDSTNIRTTLRSLMKYNFKRSFTGHFNHLRSFVLNDEAAMVMATYPKGQRPKRPFPYYNEVMTGFEYSTAAHMIYEGQVEDGLTLIKAIRDRYDGFKRSPFDEAECGHHYARAMASWAAVLALSGFHYSGVAREMQFAASQGQAQMFWSTGDAWGVFQQKPAQDGVEVELEVKGGSLSLRRLTVAGTGSLILEAEQRLGRGQKVSGMIHQTKSDADSGH